MLLFRFQYAVVHLSRILLIQFQVQFARPETTNTRNIPSHWVNCNAVTTSCMSHEGFKRSKRWIRQYFHSP